MLRESHFHKSSLGLFTGLSLILSLVAGSGSGYAASQPRTALKGYDPVAYFTIGEPTPGNPDFQLVMDGVRYQFATSEHLSMFKQDPEKYTPRFAALCAMGLAAKGYKVEANPENWVIHEGQLYLTQQDFGPTIFRKAPSRWAAAAAVHLDVLKNAPVGTGLSWF